MSDNNRWKSIGLVALLILSPWLAVQGWILVGAPLPTHTSLPTCPEGTQNCASLGAGGLVRMDGDLQTTIDANVSEVWDAFETWSSENGLNVERDVEGEDGSSFSHRVAITPFWRFPDDVVVSFQPIDDDSTAISLYSSSPLGVSDLCVHPDRLMTLHEALMNA